ncbi:MAG: YihY/virulence factor BrkB family protein [Polyangiaceae bacterium]
MGTLAIDAGTRWAGDACYRLGASLAYYALFALFPLLLLAVTAVGFFLSGDNAARQEILNSVASETPGFRALLGQTLESMQTHRTARGIGAIVGSLALVAGASGFFSELEWSFDVIWRVETRPSKGLWATLLSGLKSKALSFAVVVGAAFALLASLAIGTALQAIGRAAIDRGAAETFWQLVEALASFAFLTGLFATMYRIVPQANVKWRDVLGGALVTSLLFTGLKWLLAWYFAHVSSYAAYGAVGAVLGLLTWIYVATLIILYGAEWSRVYAERFGSLAQPGAGVLVAPPVEGPGRA